MTWHSGAGLDALPVARLHPLVRDTSRPAPGPDLLALRNWPPVRTACRPRLRVTVLCLIPGPSTVLVERETSTVEPPSVEPRLQWPGPVKQPQLS